MRIEAIQSWKLRVSSYLKREWLKKPCLERLKIIEILDKVLKDLDNGSD